jgi:hypothetical protein
VIVLFLLRFQGKEQKDFKKSLKFTIRERGKWLTRKNQPFFQPKQQRGGENGDEAKLRNC